MSSPVKNSEAGCIVAYLCGKVNRKVRRSGHKNKKYGQLQKKFFDRGNRVCYNEHMRIYSDNGSLCLQIGEKMTISGITAFAEYPGAHHNMLKTQSGRWEI